MATKINSSYTFHSEIASVGLTAWGTTKKAAAARRGSQQVFVETLRFFGKPDGEMGNG
jgi:hypothetical protein